ncbi:hypothetical protein [Streptomyces sp. NPDC012888]|uniref:hypothetical protein n=1 Tax=Streptomyces sp. NPDC012888 TaxID=3364855 RepID=UPI00368D75D4
MLHSPATPDPAHTRTRPAHWAATTAAIAAVVATAGLIQPEPAAGRPPAATTGPAAAPGRPAPGRPAPDANAGAYPLDCRGGPHQVTATAEGDLDGDGNAETVAAVRCETGIGTPPSALYVLTHDPRDPGRPRVVATLVDTTRRQNVTELAVTGRAVHATLLGYSGPGVPRCCPDLAERLNWRWSGGGFRQERTDAAAPTLRT